MLGSRDRAAKRMRNGRVKLMAAAWFARMRSDNCTSDDERRLQAWLEADPDHQAAYADIRRTFETVGSVADAPEIMEMRRAARRSRPVMRRLPVGVPSRAASAAIAACLTLAIAAGVTGMLWAGWGRHDVYRTGAGERSTVALNDATLVTLTSNSRLTVAFSSRLRKVRLERGEAYFEVMQDPGRPFVVQAGDGQITALGTEFDVFNQNGEVVVTLVEGQVEVASLDKRHTEEAPVKLQAGEQVSYVRNKLSEVRKVDSAQVVSWRRGRIVVDGEPFLEVVDKFNRHSKYQLYVDREDPRLKELVISGTITTDRPERLVQYLKDAEHKVWTAEDSSGNIKLRLYPKTSGK